MRKGRFGSLVGLCCGVLLAGSAVAAEQSPEDLQATIERLNARLEKLEGKETAGESDRSGLLDSVIANLNPKFGGDANFEYDTRDSNQGDGFTSRVRLTMSADLGPRFYLHTRLTAKQYISGHENNEDRFSQAAGYENEAIKVGMEQLYVGYRLEELNTELRAGRQPLWLANGMLADINGINGISVRTSLLGVNALGFYGRNGTHDLMSIQKNGKDAYYHALELSRGFGPVELGATYLKVDDQYYGVNAKYVLPINAFLYAQYVTNDDAADNDQGYRIGAKYGNAGKKGEWDIDLAYLRVEDSINPNQNWFVNDGNWVGAKGIRAKAHYAITDRTTLVLVQDFFDNIESGERQNRTDIELEFRF